MSSDIGQDILRSVKADFAKALDDQSGRLGRLFKKIQDGKASMSEISTFSVLIGQTVSSAVEKRVTPEALPNGTLYFNIAQTVLQGILKDSHELINLAASSVQEKLDAQQGLHIRAVKPEYPEERVKSIAGAASTASMNSNGEKEQRRLTSPVENVVQSFYSDYVRENADLRSKAGLNAYIVRRTSGKCCAWCADLAGRYRYEDAPPDVYARHDNCTCTVDFVTNNYRQDVWSKRKYALSPTQRRAILDNIPKPTRYTREQAERLQNNAIQNLRAQFPKDFRDTRSVGTPISSELLKNFADTLTENGIVFADVKGSKYGGFDTYCGDPQVLNDIVEHIKNNQEILTKLSGNSKIIVGYDYLREGGNVEVDTFAQTKGRTIIFNKFMYDDSNYLKSEYQKAVENRQFAKGTTYLNVVDHEMGHIYAKENPLYLSSLERVCEERAIIEGMSIDQYCKSYISKYSTVYRELPAEVNSMRFGNNREFALELLREAKLI